MTKEITTPDGLYTLSKDQFGETITDNANKIAYAERNQSEREVFNELLIKF